MSLISAALACAMLHGAASSPQQMSDALGFIVDITGRWEISRGSGAKPVPAERRAVLRAGDVLQKRDEDPMSLVAVAMYTGAMEKYRQTTYLTGRATTGTLTRVLLAIQQRFQQGWISASVRGGGDFNDAIVKSGDDRIDVSAVFTDAEAGAYAITIYALIGGKLTTPARSRVSIVTGRGPITVPKLPPGLYQVDVSGAEPDTNGNAWIRVVPAEQFNQTAKEFLQLPGADGAGGPELRKAARAIARTYLIVLSDTTPSKG